MNYLSSCFRISSLLVVLTMTLPALAEDLPPVSELPVQEELPDAFVTMDGTRITTPEEWYDVRRPELIKLFTHYMYGYMPENVKVKFTEDAAPAEVMNGKAIVKQIAISFPELEAENAPQIHLALFLPNKAEQKFPVFLAVNKCGNHTVIPDEAILTFPTHNLHDYCEKPENGARGSKLDYWCLEYLIERGYGFATYHVNNVDPDTHDFTDGVHPHFKDVKGPKESRWGTISAWAWGLQRCVDYLLSDAQVRGDCIAVTGHSRRGKTALWATATDERIALCIPHQSGTGGMALSRNNEQETVKRINEHFPHWFNDTFTKFNDNETQIPFDQHLLIACVAPRPLMETSGLKDTWANYNSSVKAIQAADAVYKFLGAPGIKGDPIINGGPVTEENCGNLAQYRLDTRHVLELDYWKGILDFADLQFGEKLK
ncbi:MAG: acetylxylan esterase [Planctomyces sp.]|nr:acetylxylan esterase [Planctomyces sp.]